MLETMKLLKKILVIYVFTIVSWIIVTTYYSKNIVCVCSTSHPTDQKQTDKIYKDIQIDNNIVTLPSTVAVQQVTTNKQKDRTKAEISLSNITQKEKLIRDKVITDNFRSFYVNASADQLNDPFIHQHRYIPLLNNVFKCYEKDVFLLVFVHITTSNFEGRHLIRSTFGSISNFDNKLIEYVFVLGQTKNETLQRNIKRESEIYKDIVQGNFIDSYRNLTYKLVFSLFWVNKFCNNAKFVIKMDEDITINVPRLIPYLSKKVDNTSTSNILECKMITRNKPQRRRRHKWYISLKEYPFSRFLPYCAGHSSIMSIDIVRKMYNASTKVPFLWLEDVYGSGFLSLLSQLRISMPNCYISPVKRNLKAQPCYLFYLNNLKSVNNSITIWETIKSHNISLSCKC